MKNTIILSFLLIPVLIACQNSVNVSSNISAQPSKSTVATTTPSINIISNVTPSANISLSTSSPGNPVNPTPSDIIQESVTPVIESNMLEFIPYPSNLPTLPPLPSPGNHLENKEFYGYNRSSNVHGTVYDKDGNFLPDITVTLKNVPNVNNYIYSGYDYSVSTKTNDKGFYKITAPEEMLFVIIAQKDNEYTKRSYYDHVQETGRQISPNDFGGQSSKYNYLSKAPEIEKIKINGNIITKFDYEKLVLNPLKNNLPSKNYFSTIKLGTIDPKTEVEKFKMKSVDDLIVELEFNNSIKRLSFENSVYLQSLDKSIEYNNQTKKSFFQWSNNDKKVIFKLPISKKLESTKYRLAFKNSFIDINGSLSLDTCMAIQEPYRLSTELSENIVFEIEGNKQ